MRLLFTSTSYPPSVGGAQLLQHRTAIELSVRHDIQVVTHWDSNRSDWLVGTTLGAPSRARDYYVDGIPVHRLGVSGLDKLLLFPAVLLYYPLMGAAVRVISSTLEAQLAPYASQSDLIHNVRIGREALTHASLHSARKQDIPFVLTPVHHPRWSGWRYRLYIELYRQADAVIALTEAEKRALEGFGVHEGRIHVGGFGPILARGSNPDDFTARHNLDGPIVLFLGQHYLYKGYRQLLEAAPMVWAKLPAVQFVFVGRAVDQSDEDFAGKKDARILRLGEVDLQTKTDALAACTILCVPSTQESFGGVYTEAWSFGKPVIGCRIPAVSEVVTDGQDGLLVDQGTDAIAEAIVALLTNPSLATRMGEAGRMKVHEKYTWDRIARVTEAAYHEVLGTRPA